MRVLFLATPVPSHVAPMMPLAWALRAAGHEVLVVGQPDIVPTVQAAGLSCVTFGAHYHVLDLLQDMPTGVPSGGTAGTHTRPWAMHARYTTEPYLAFAQDWGPDLIVADRLEYSCLIVGAALGVPVVQHRYGVDLLAAGAWQAGRAMLTRLGRHFGIADGLPEPTLVVDPCPPSLQVPGIPPAEVLRFVPSNGAAVVPEWVGERPAPHRVCASLGNLTVAAGGVALPAAIAAAAAELPEVEFVLTLDADSRDELGPVASNVRLVDPLPLDLFVDSCAAVIHHGGAGSTLTATAFGLPQVAVPQSAAVLPTAERLAATGAGLALVSETGVPEVAAIRHAVTEVLGASSHRSAAAALRAEMAAAPTPAEFVAHLERHVVGERETPCARC